MKTTMTLTAGLLALLTPFAAKGQDVPKGPVHTYRLTYTLTESEAGKRSNVQHYYLTATPEGHANLKIGSKVPIMTKDGGSGGQSEYQYLDLGLSISATLKEQENGVLLASKFEQSSMAPPMPAMPNEPLIRQMVLENTSTLVPGKVVKISSSDIPDSTRHVDLEVELESNP